MAANKDISHGLNLAPYNSIKISIYGGDIKMFYIAQIPVFTDNGQCTYNMFVN